MNISTLALLGGAAMIGLIIFGKIGVGKGLLIGAGLIAVGAATQPDSKAVSS